jgi:hypothetical protein
VSIPQRPNSDRVVRLAEYDCLNVKRVIAAGTACGQELRNLSDLDLIRELARQLRDGSSSAPGRNRRGHFPRLPEARGW